jgi:hypothetical protein
MALTKIPMRSLIGGLFPRRGRYLRSLPLAWVPIVERACGHKDKRAHKERAQYGTNHSFNVHFAHTLSICLRPKRATQAFSQQESVQTHPQLPLLRADEVMQ